MEFSPGDIARPATFKVERVVAGQARGPQKVRRSFLPDRRSGIKEQRRLSLSMVVGRCGSALDQTSDASSDFRLWPEADLGTVVPYVCYRLTNGQRRLKARSSAFDSNRTRRGNAQKEL